MDNLTHSLAGAILGQMGLKKKTGLAMPTLIIAANISDIDAVAMLLGGHAHLGIRRGITHGPIALVILPLLLWAAMLWFDRWQTKRGTRPQKRLPVHKGWLLTLAFIGAISHPALDWLNVYGVRILEPFTDKWFYGDTLFIIDIWVWIALIVGVWISIRREKCGQANWQRPAWISFTAICAYIFANGAITGHAESSLHDKLHQSPHIVATDNANAKPMVVASPVPVKFWEREMFWRQGKLYGETWYSLVSGMEEPGAPKFHHADDEQLSVLAKQDADVSAFLFWSRMPLLFREGDNMILGDQRFNDPLVSDRFNLKIKSPAVQKDGLESAVK